MILLEIASWAIPAAAMMVLFVAMAWLLAEFKGMKDEFRERFGLNNETIKLQLQAYERLTLFAERAALKNLVSRTPHAGLNVVDFQLDMIQALRDEYEYNVTQQIYVSPDMWKAIGNLKDQNIYIINQLAATVPSQAPGIELGKRILEYVSINKNAELNTVVLEALHFEAKKLL